MANANKIAPWIRTITSDEPAGGGSSQTDGHEKTSTNQNQNHKGENAGHAASSDGDSDGESDGEDDSAGKKPTDWRSHAKHWEKQSKQNLTALEKARRELSDKETQLEQMKTDVAKRDAAVQQLQILQTLVSIGADVAVLSDSRSFMSKAEALDCDDPDFEQHIRDLVAERKTPSSNTGSYLPEGSHSKGGKDLWELMHGSEKE